MPSEKKELCELTNDFLVKVCSVIEDDDGMEQYFMACLKDVGRTIEEYKQTRHVDDVQAWVDCLLNAVQTVVLETIEAERQKDALNLMANAAQDETTELLPTHTEEE